MDRIHRVDRAAASTSRSAVAIDTAGDANPNGADLDLDR
jgi:hypothetical protein